FAFALNFLKNEPGIGGLREPGAVTYKTRIALRRMAMRQSEALYADLHDCRISGTSRRRGKGEGRDRRVRPVREGERASHRHVHRMAEEGRSDPVRPPVHIRKRSGA